jgi:hypothetical protein
MTKLRPQFIGCLILCAGVLTQCASRGASADDLSGRMLAEKRHFFECLAVVYSPDFWISYNDALYFQARNEAQVRQLEAMKLARSRYVALTNRETRYAIAAKAIAASGIDEGWQRKILLPLSTTNQDLTPTLSRPLQMIPKYKVLRSLAQGDALLQDDTTSYFVMNFSRGADDASGTNVWVVKEGVKTFSDGGGFKTVGAFANVSLSKEEKAVLNRVAAALHTQATALVQQIDAPKAREEFEACKARATDSNPYMQYLLARCYLEGKGTDKDETLGMEWMTKAAKSGSGDAINYLEKAGHRAP